MNTHNTLQVNTMPAKPSDSKSDANQNRVVYPLQIQVPVGRWDVTAFRPECTPLVRRLGPGRAVAG
jgi:hypothetical protein